MSDENKAESSKFLMPKPKHNHSIENISNISSNVDNLSSTVSFI